MRCLFLVQELPFCFDVVAHLDDFQLGLRCLIEEPRPVDFALRAQSVLMRVLGLLDRLSPRFHGLPALVASLHGCLPYGFHNGTLPLQHLFPPLQEERSRLLLGFSALLPLLGVLLLLLLVEPRIQRLGLHYVDPRRIPVRLFVSVALLLPLRFHVSLLPLRFDPGVSEGIPLHLDGLLQLALLFNPLRHFPPALLLLCNAG
mmetsp:Transcript_7085/g.18328  ORF Transcript_7085/g.18328 Transcript_7085/m.18328 type:complete len:202 (+) Transcript_7085:552-1157(+)